MATMTMLLISPSPLHQKQKREKFVWMEEILLLGRKEFFLHTKTIPDVSGEREMEAPQCEDAHYFVQFI